MAEKNNNMNGKNDKKGFGYYFRNYGFVFLLILAVAFMLIYSNSNVKTEEMDINTVVSKIESGEIISVYIPNGSEKGRILLSSASDDDKNKFPDKYEYWVVLNNQNITLIYEAIQNTDNDGDGKPDCTIVNSTTPVDIMSYILPVAYILILIVSLFLIYRLVSRAGGKGGSFGKNKIKNGQFSKIKFDDVAGIKEEKAELEEIVDFLKEPAKYTQIGARIPKGVLLVGDPGTGKTLLAKAIAGESGVPFFSMSGSDFVEMFVGVGASRVRDLFEEAKKNAPCIIFIDEIDAVGRKRGAGLGGGNDEREQTLNQLLVEMDGFDGNEGIIIIAATNRVDILDPALTRPGRFDRKVVIYPPDIKGREDILKIHAKNKKVAYDVDYKVLARLTSGFTGANLESLMNEAALRAAKNGRHEITMVDITESVNKVILGVQKKSRVLVQKDREITAYHESGHAILGLMLPNCSEVQEVSIIPRGFAGGYTLSREEDNVYTTFNRLNDEIAMCMGGRIAESIQFGDITTGASNDIVQATKLARKMVTEWGMSESLGFINLADDEDMFMGGGVRRNASISEKTASNIDEEVNKILEYNYTRAEKLLRDNKGILDEMAKVLLDRETIYKEDLDKLLAGEKAEDLIKEIEKRENEKQKQELSSSIKFEVLNLLERVIKSKNSLRVMRAGNVINDEQYNKLFDGLKAEYNEKRDAILKKIKDNGLNLDCEKELTDYEDIVNIEAFHKKVAGEAFMRAANKEAQAQGKDIPFPEVEDNAKQEISKGQISIDEISTETVIKDAKEIEGVTILQEGTDKKYSDEELLDMIMGRYEPKDDKNEKSIQDTTNEEKDVTKEQESKDKESKNEKMKKANKKDDSDK